MYTHVTVIPADATIIVDGVPLCFSFPALPELHAIQWLNGVGHIEYTTGAANKALTVADYTTAVLPFVRLWEAEKARLAEEERKRQEEANKPPTLEEARTTALAALATRRWHAETAGIRVNGLDIPTDRESQSLITGAVAGTLLDPAQTVRWKTATRDEHGTPIFVTLTAEAIRAVALAVRAHVQLCFDCEAVKSAQVGMLGSVAAVDEWTATQMGIGWPGEVPPGG